MLCNPKLKELLIGADALSEYVVKEYISFKVRVKAYFKRGKINPSITLDIWTSPNGFSILAITAHWVDDDYVLREIILDSVELIGSHSGVNIAKSVLKCLKEFEIDEIYK